jgi:hypothetical protein
MATELRRALSQIEEIHAQMARGEVFRGYRAATMALTSVVAMGGAAAWQLLFRDGGPLSRGLIPAGSGPLAPWHLFIAFWTGVAFVCFGLCAADLLLQHRRSPCPTGVRRAWLMVGQFAPSLLAGAAVTLAFIHLDGTAALERTTPRAMSLLPGVWALIYGLGIFASRPYLPRAIGAVGLFYLVAGILQLLRTSVGPPDSVGMGLTFGLGQAAIALVLHLDLERPPAFVVQDRSRSSSDVS